MSNLLIRLWFRKGGGIGIVDRGPKIGLSANIGCKETELTPAGGGLAFEYETRRTQRAANPRTCTLWALWQPHATGRQRAAPGRGQD